jgi:hypothetical protein
MCPAAYSLEKQLAMKSYSLQTVQAINEDDNVPKFIFCGEFLNSTLSASCWFLASITVRIEKWWAYFSDTSFDL